MKFSLIICTYMRPKELLTLMNSVKEQTLYPDEIIIVDGSTNYMTYEVFKNNTFKNLKYFKVTDKDRGLTKQRNFGISKISKDIDIVSFLDDDTFLFKNYFEELLKTYKSNKKITAVGGIAVNDCKWEKKEEGTVYPKHLYYELHGYVLKEGLRNILRNYLGLQSKLMPGVMPEFSNGRTPNYPLNNKIYEVDLLIGMSFSFRRIVTENIKFSKYFEGYGLYEDADYSLRALKYGINVINTKVKLNHYHNPKGRPNKFEYGKMVVRNGWYVWRVKYPNPTLKARFKWNTIAFLLTSIRYFNVVNTSKKKEALSEALGRTYGWFTLLYNKPKHTV